MRFIATIASLIFTSLVFAKSYDLKLDLSLAGKSVGSPRLIVKENEKASFITEDGKQKMTIEVIAQDASSKEVPNGIKLDFRINHIELANNKTIEIAPALIVKDNSPASITTNTDTGEEILLSVTSKAILPTN